jgi:diaminopimelate epimerase
MKFTKMHGLGNDFIVIDEREKQIKTDFIGLAKKLCDRHLGIGADGLIRVLPSKTGDYKMEIINSDGSVPEMCGNGIRCFAKFIYDNETKPKTEYKVETGAGILIPVLDVKNKNVTGITVDMGEQSFGEMTGTPLKMPCIFRWATTLFRIHILMTSLPERSGRMASAPSAGATLLL